MNIIKFSEFINESKTFKYDLGCVMLNLKVDNWNKEILSIIDKEDIYDEPKFGLEDKSHVTVFFGIKPEESEPSEVKKVLKESDIDIDKEYKLQNISIFENDDYDVVKFDVKDCKELEEMNKFIKKTFPNKQDFPKYEPHVTVGYVKKGKGKKYIQKIDTPIIATPSRITYSYPIDDGKSKRTINIIEY